MGVDDEDVFEFDASPHAAALIEGLRDFGYTLETALADLVDNSISAGADRIEILADTNDSHPRLAILDNGGGMDASELKSAMRPGSRDPLGDRDGSDLGRFGLGMKTASFSQCRRLTVLSRKDGRLNAAQWDLDYVKMTDKWSVRVPRDVGGIPWNDLLVTDGTLVVWEELDRLVGRDAAHNATSHMVARLDEAVTHLEFVFHRFLSGYRGGPPKLEISLNHRPLKPLDPFNEKSSFTIAEPTEHIRVEGKTVLVTAYTLPHHANVNTRDWDRFAGPDGYQRNQGFYVYRSHRLIVWGTWFGLLRQSEATKLSRVKIDIPNDMDHLWKINVLKASAQPPREVRERLRLIRNRIVAGSKRVYDGRGKVKLSKDKMPVWVRVQHNDRISYGLNRDHPVLDSFVAQLEPARQRDFSGILQMISSAIPLDAVLADMASDPQAVEHENLDASELKGLVTTTAQTMRSREMTWSLIAQILQHSPPFAQQWPDTQNTLKELEAEGL